MTPGSYAVSVLGAGLAVVLIVLGFYLLRRNAARVAPSPFDPERFKLPPKGSEKEQHWKDHPEFEKIRAACTYLCGYLSSPLADPKSELTGIRQCAEGYRRLWSFGFIQTLPLFEKIQGLPEEVDRLLPDYAFKDQFLTRVKRVFTNLGPEWKTEIEKTRLALQEALGPLPELAE